MVVVGVLSGELSTPVVVRLLTMDGTALSDRDYSSLNQTLTFSPDTTTQVISVPLLDDSIDEEDETFLASLELDSSSDDQNIQIQPDEATLLILDDDGKVFTIDKNLMF